MFNNHFNFNLMKNQRLISIILVLIITILLQKSISAQQSPQVNKSASQFKLQLEGYVRMIAKQLQQVYQDRCNNTSIRNCSKKAIWNCNGTGKRICLKGSLPLIDGKELYVSMQSVVKGPNTLVPQSMPQSLKEFLCSAANSDIDSLLIDVAKKNKRRYGFILVGSRDGYLYKNPGESYSNYNPGSTACSDYDARVRPWFKQAVYGRKNIIILIGNKNTFELSSETRLTTVKASVKAILKTTYPDDHMAIITFADQAKSLLNLSTLSKVNSKVNSNSNRTYGDLFFQQIDQHLSFQKNNKNNYQNALNLAFQMIQQRQDSNTSIIQAQQQYFFMLFTDGNPTEGLTSYQAIMSLINNRTEQINFNKSSERKIKISLVGFNVDPDPKKALLIKNWSCLQNGMYINIGNVKVEAQFLTQASQFYDYQILNNQVDAAVWSPQLIDGAGFGEVRTVTYPSYQTVDGQKKLIAVVGINVLVSSFKEYESDLIKLNLLLNDGGRKFANRGTECQIQKFRKFKCESLNCSDSSDFNCPLPITANAFKQPTDTSNIKFCPVPIEKKDDTGTIIGAIIGVLSVVTIIIVVILYKKGIIFQGSGQNVPGQYISNQARSRERFYRQEQASGNILGQQ